jgi:soluble lytic murein transglycosylase-like protein
MGTDLSTQTARLTLAGKWATKYGLERELVCAVIEQESGWNPWAIRFEPGFLREYIKPVDPSHPSTREITCSCSFGLCQVMGEVAVELGWRGSFLTELCDPDTGVDFGCRKLQQCFNAHGRDVTSSLLAYNGGGNPAYAEQVLARVSRYVVDPTAGANSVA